MRVDRSSDRSKVMTGFGLFCLHAAVVPAIAAWLLRRRDA
jgi:hypothetical protein